MTRAPQHLLTILYPMFQTNQKQVNQANPGTVLLPYPVHNTKDHQLTTKLLNTNTFLYNLLFHP